MLPKIASLSFAAATAALLAASALPASAITLQECSAKYKAAKEANTLQGMKWNDFRKAQCGENAAAAPAAGTTSTTAAQPAPKTTPPPRATTGSASAGQAVFPTAVAPKYSKDSAGKARRETCLDQYNANKANNANAGLKWIEKGGGYYSECNKRLKGA